jgi:hypothetical protein
MMGDLLVSKLWIAAAEKALVEADVALSEVQFATVTSVSVSGTTGFTDEDLAALREVWPTPKAA